jgi:hypothetical protein
MFDETFMLQFDRDKFRLQMINLINIFILFGILLAGVFCNSQKALAIQFDISIVLEIFYLVTWSVTLLKVFTRFKSST